MGRAVRRVHKDWKHPTWEDGHPRPVLSSDYSFDEDYAKWEEELTQWQSGLRKEGYGDNAEWIRFEEKYKWVSYAEYEDCLPKPYRGLYMPEWTPEEMTHYQMYETVSEGTPLSPVMESPEALAHWLADNDASAGPDATATYEQWLRVCQGGYAPSLVIIGGQPMSGVEALGQKPKEKL